MREGLGYDCTLSPSLSFITYEPFSAVFDARREECLKSQRHEMPAARPPAHSSVFAAVCFSPSSAPAGGAAIFQALGGTQRCFAAWWRFTQVGKKNRVCAQTELYPLWYLWVK